MNDSKDRKKKELRDHRSHNNGKIEWEKNKKAYHQPGTEFFFFLFVIAKKLTKKHRGTEGDVLGPKLYCAISTQFWETTVRQNLFITARILLNCYLPMLFLCVGEVIYPKSYFLTKRLSFFSLVPLIYFLIYGKKITRYFFRRVLLNERGKNCEC